MNVRVAILVLARLDLDPADAAERLACDAIGGNLRSGLGE